MPTLPLTLPFALEIFLGQLDSDAAILKGFLGSQIPGAKIDEYAIMTKDGMETELFEALVAQGWERFNAATDAPITGPIPSHYQVIYTFFRKPGVDYRLEIMTIMNGVSPLHQALKWTSKATVPFYPVHASFKVDSELNYAGARQALEDCGYTEAQNCRSAYGRFSYYCQPSGFATPYLKPRVNLRDAR